MHCLACNAEMILIQVVQDDTMPVPGFEWRTFRCSACHDEERRLVFSRRDPEPTPMPAAPSIADGQSEKAPTPLMDTAPSIADGQSENEPTPLMASAPSIADGQSEKAPTPLMDTAPSITPASALQDAPPAAPGLFRRVVAKMRAR
jgi:hypothetical protein